MRRRLRQGCRWAWYACLASAQHRSCVNIAHDYIVPHPPHQPTPAHARPRPSTAHPLPTMSCIPFPRSLRPGPAFSTCTATLPPDPPPVAHPAAPRDATRRPAPPALSPPRAFATSQPLATSGAVRCPTCRPLGYCAFLARWPRAQTRAVHVAARAQQHVAECGEREQR